MDIRVKLLAVAATGVFLTACGNKTGNDGPDEDETPVLTAHTLGEQTVLSVSDYLARAQYAGADTGNGANQARICKACHSLDAGGPNMIGPGLHGFFGRRAGEREGFGYSSVLRDAGFVWTPRALDAWLRQPGRFLPGNSMTFAGVMQQQDRDDLIAYLLDVTSRSASDD